MSKSWEYIRQRYEELPRMVKEENRGRIEGSHQMLELIPLLEQHDFLNSAVRNLSHFCLVLRFPDKKGNVTIIPPGPYFTGSSNEFAVALYDGVSDEARFYQIISASDLSEVVSTVEAFLQKLQTGSI